jgi:hypothetical protein
MTDIIEDEKFNLCDSGKPKKMRGDLRDIIISHAAFLAAHGADGELAKQMATDIIDFVNIYSPESKSARMRSDNECYWDIGDYPKNYPMSKRM